MPAIQAADIADIGVATLKNLGRLKMTDVISTYQNTIIFKRLWRKKKMTFSGDQSQFNLMFDENHSARSTGLYYSVNFAPTNVLTNASMPWRHWHYNWAVERREVAMNTGAENKIVDLFKTRRYAALASAILFLERKGWQAATSSSDDFQGIPYWIVKSNTAVTTNDGFNGTVPSGHTVVANLNPSSQSITPKWNNYAAQYTAVSKEDLIDKWERMIDFTDFMPLVDEIPTYNVGDDYGFYTNYSVLQSLKRILEAQNESLGFDLDPVNGKVVFRRSPVTWVKQLDNDTTNPIYSINWGEFHFMGLRGEVLREQMIPVLSNQPTVTGCVTDTSMNTYCTNRRRQGILATDTTMPALV